MAAGNPQGPPTPGQRMTLADSNLVIYAARDNYDWLVDWFAAVAPSVSAVTRVEALGFHKLVPKEKDFLDEFFPKASILSISEEVILQATALRQQKRMSLGDALIAATALVHGLTLATRNMEDFQWIPRLSLIDPFERRPDSTKEGASL